MKIGEMTVFPVHGDYEEYMTLLLDADPSRELVECYLRRGQLWSCADEKGPVCVALMMPVEDGGIELMNMCTRADRRHQGIAHDMIMCMKQHYAPLYRCMNVGTANGFPEVQRFYENCGFVFDRMDEQFFIRNYSEPIFDGGKQCIDMIRYTMPLDSEK